MIPGQYELVKNPDIKSLIKSAGGLKENALKKRAYIIREIDGFQQEVKTVDLEGALSMAEKYNFKNNDKLVIPSLEELYGSK